MNLKIISFILIVTLAIFIGAFTFNSPNVVKEDLNPNQNSKEILETGEVKEFTVEAFQFGFDPGTIEVNQGDKVKLTAYSSDIPHGLAIFEYGINMYLDSTPRTIEFIADKKGTFYFYCSVSCGIGHGEMTGRLVVN